MQGDSRTIVLREEVISGTEDIPGGSGLGVQTGVGI